MPLHEKGYKEFLKGLSYKEIAKKLDVKYNTVRVWASKQEWRKRKTITEREIEGQIKENYSKVLLRIKNRIGNLINNSLRELEQNKRISIDLKLLEKIVRINKNSSGMLKILLTMLITKEKDFEIKYTENSET